METTFKEKTENKLAKIQPDQLESVIKNSGLAIIEAEEIKTAYLPFLVRLTEVQDQAAKINFESPVELDETIARELRLKTVKIRTDAEKLKDEQKRVDILRGKVKQDSFNLISSSCKLAEEVFFNVEKAREIAEKKRKAQLKIDREEKLGPYTEAVSLYPLGEMSEDQFNELYSGLRIAHENKLAAEKKAEEDRIAKEKAEAEERELQRLENIRLKEEAIENERLAEIVRNKQAAILAKQKEEADAEKKALENKLETERIQRENIEVEIKRKKEAEEKLKKAKAAAEKKAKLAPDKTKLLNFMQSINDLPRPEVKSIEAANIASNANTLLVKVANYIKENSDKL